MELPLFLSLRSLVKSGVVERDTFIAHYKEGMAHFKAELNWNDAQMKTMLDFGDTLEHNL